MEWDIAPKTRCDIIAFSGINFSGRRAIVSIHPVGGRQGEEIDAADIQSIAIVGRPGTRVVLKSSVSESDWQERPWRCVTVTADAAYKTPEGKQAVRVPDIDFLDKPNAQRTDPDFQAGYDQVGALDEGKGWTFGRSGATPLKGNVRAIRVENT